MTEPEPPSTWDGQPVNLSRHLFNLYKMNTRSTSRRAAYPSWRPDWRGHETRQDLYVHNNLQALVRTCRSYQALPTAAKPYSFDTPAPGTILGRDPQQAFSHRGLLRFAPRGPLMATRRCALTSTSSSRQWPDIGVDYTDELSADLAKRYTIAPEELANTSRVLQCGCPIWDLLFVPA
eukprot:3965252-Prymnesium_polylepis.1